MKNIMSKYPKQSFALLFAICVFSFWMFRFPFVLAYQEQMQLFLWNDSFLMEYLTFPGGIASYLGQFLVQFFNNISLGSLIMTLAITGVQQLCWRIIIRQQVSDALYPLSSLPALGLWLVMADEDVLMTYVVAVLVSLLMMCFVPRRPLFRLLYLLFISTVGFWILGIAVLMPVVYIGFVFANRHKTIDIIMGVIGICIVFVCAYASAWIVPYPLVRIMKGIDYFRFPIGFDVWLYLWMVFALLVLTLSPVVQKLSVPISVTTRFFLGILLVGVVAGISLPLAYDRDIYDDIEYDFMVRTQRWQDIINKSAEMAPVSSTAECAVALAQWKEQQMTNQQLLMFMKRANRMPKTELTVMMLNEIYFRVNMVNASQRFAFEGVEFIPNYKKSGRLIKRLAETNLVNGEYDVARKYLQMLQETIYYREWADKTMSLVDHPQLILQHPLYGLMRKYLSHKDTMFI